MSDHLELLTAAGYCFCSLATFKLWLTKVTLSNLVYSKSYNHTLTAYQPLYKVTDTSPLPNNQHALLYNHQT
jgi:hypothetical protein